MLKKLKKYKKEVTDFFGSSEKFVYVKQSKETATKQREENEKQRRIKEMQE